MSGSRTSRWRDRKRSKGRTRASRMVLFRLYYLGLAPYENARHFLGLSERSWVQWTEEIRQRCGKELLRREMFPPRKYFRESHIALEARKVNAYSE